MFTVVMVKSAVSTSMTLLGFLTLYSIGRGRTELDSDCLMIAL